MQIRDSIIIAAAPEIVWNYLADPILQSGWNPKIILVTRSKSGPVQYRERFEMTYRMSGRDRPSKVEVTTCEPPSRIVFRHRMPDKKSDCTLDESYEIEPVSEGVRVTQTIDFTNAEIPWFLRALIWFITRCGHGTEEPYMHRLKTLVEGTDRSCR